jgi:DNA-binding Lrp family transcriptional regulator
MTTKAYVLIETAVGKTKDVLRALEAVRGMEAVDAVTGRYDLIAVLTAEDLNSIGDVVTQSVHTIGGIIRTETCLSVTVR